MDNEECTDITTPEIMTDEDFVSLQIKKAEKEADSILEHLEEAIKIRPSTFQLTEYTLNDKLTKIEYWISGENYRVYAPMEIKFTDKQQSRFARIFATFQDGDYKDRITKLVSLAKDANKQYKKDILMGVDPLKEKDPF